MNIFIEDETDCSAIIDAELIKFYPLEHIEEELDNSTYESELFNKLFTSSQINYFKREAEKYESYCNEIPCTVVIFSNSQAIGYSVIANYTYMVVYDMKNQNKLGIISMKDIKNHICTAWYDRGEEM